MGGKYLVGRGIGGEANVAVDSETDVFVREVGDGGVYGDDLVGEGGDVGFPVLEGAAVLGVVHWVGVSACLRSWLDGWLEVGVVSERAYT